MRVEKQIRFNEWLLGSTILCPSCGCLWLVPTAQQSEIYVCRQCGSRVTAKSQTQTTNQQPAKSDNTKLWSNQPQSAIRNRQSAIWLFPPAEFTFLLLRHRFFRPGAL